MTFNFPSSRRSRRRAGFTLVEVIIDAIVITLIFGAVIGSFLFILNATNSGRIRTLAGSLANEQMEYLRDLPYASLATQDGSILPQGNIPDSQNITRGSVTFTLTTTIIFVDDPLDGCAIPNGGNSYLCTDGATSSTFDPVPVDYKRISVAALRTGTPTILTKLSSNAAAKAAETPGNTGMLLIKVTDAQGLPVGQATVSVDNVNPSVSLDTLTNDQGYVFIANLPLDSHNGYHVTTTKAGYSADGTTSRTSQNPNQVQPDVNVSLQQVTTQSLKIDLLSNMTVTVTNETGSAIPNITLTATSDKTVAFNPDTPKNTYTQTTDASGAATFTNIEWDSYSLTASGNYLVVTTSPYEPVSVDPNTTLPVSLVLTSNQSWPRITAVAPDSATSGSTTTIVISGSNFTGNSTVTFHKAGSTDITPITTDVNNNQKTITVNVNLTGAAAGDWDIIINSAGKVVTELGGLTVS